MSAATTAVVSIFGINEMAQSKFRKRILQPRSTVDANSAVFDSFYETTIVRTRNEHYYLKKKKK